MILHKKIILKTSILLLFVVNYSSVAAITSKGSLRQTDTFAVLKLNGYTRVRSLKEKNGKFIGYIYVKENTKYKNHVLSALLVVKAKGLKLDTLYQINSHGDFINFNLKIELKNRLKDYYGFKLYKERKGFEDYLNIGLVDSKGRLFSDDNNYFVDWDYDTKKLVYDPAP